MIKDAQSALEKGEKIQLAYTVRSTMRTIGARLSSMVVTQGLSARSGNSLPLAGWVWEGGATEGSDRSNAPLPNPSPAEGKGTTEQVLPPDLITIRLRGTAGQSLGAFLSKGIRIELLGDANDYVGKGLSGGVLIIRPRPSNTLPPHEHTIIGNTVLYGATSGKLFASGQAGERFAVRNSGATVVVEGCGSNGCEYMTGGVAVILGSVGYNFAAGMTGGMAYVYDVNDMLMDRLNDETVVMQRLESDHWREQLRQLIAEHARETASPIAQQILRNWENECPKFWQICPKEMVNKLTHPLRVA